MPGERWAAVRASVAGIDTGTLRAAAAEWGRIVEGITLVGERMPDVGGIAYTLSVGAAAEKMLAVHKGMYETLEIAVDDLTNYYSPAGALLTWADAIDAIDADMAAAESGPTRLGALPDTTTPPATAAAAVVRDLVLQEFDRNADGYDARLRAAARDAVDTLQFACTVAFPPVDAVFADPVGPGPTR